MRMTTLIGCYALLVTPAPRPEADAAERRGGLSRIDAALVAATQHMLDNDLAGGDVFLRFAVDDGVIDWYDPSGLAFGKLDPGRRVTLFPGSLAGYDGDHVVNPETNESATLVSATWARMNDERRATVRCVMYRGPRFAQGYTLKLERVRGAWAVVSVRLAWVS